MKKNGLNVEHFRYHITITMIKVHQHALINQMLYKKINLKKIATCLPLGRYFKKEKTYLTKKKNAPNVFLN